MNKENTKTGAGRTLRSILFIVSFAVLFLAILGYMFTYNDFTALTQDDIVYVASSTPPIPTPTSVAKRMFTENFNTNYVLSEAENMNKSKSNTWWLSSGGYFYSGNGLGHTIIGPLSIDDPRQVVYLSSNPTDTDGGLHPQNIFRLVSKSKWLNYSQKVYFKIESDNLSSSSNRNSSNGVFLFNRYADEFNVYYTGVRVDGHVTIKKKIDGIYYTLAYEPFITGSKYDKDGNPNLLPKDTWIGIKSEVKTGSNGTVYIKFYVDNGKTGDWVLVTEAIDNGRSFGGSAFLEEGYVGIRTDFMDVKFQDFAVDAF